MLLGALLASRPQEVLTESGCGCGGDTLLLGCVYVSADGGVRAAITHSLLDGGYILPPFSLPSSFPSPAAALHLPRPRPRLLLVLVFTQLTLQETQLPPACP